MTVSPEPEWVAAKQNEEGRFSAMVRGLWLRLLIFAVGLWISDFAIERGVVAVVILNAALLFVIGFAWWAGRMTLGTMGVAISLAVFQLAVWVKGDDEPFANGLLLALSLILFLASLFVGNRRPTRQTAA